MKKMNMLEGSEKSGGLNHKRPESAKRPTPPPAQSLREIDRIADLENQIETWRGLHKADQELIVMLVKQNAEMKRANDRLQEELIVAISQATKDEECAEVQEMFKAMGSE